MFPAHEFYMCRQMFPQINVQLFNLEPSKPYVLLIDMSPVDKFRYKYYNSAWIKSFKEKCSSTHLFMYVHPDSPALGSHWMDSVVTFNKLKLTNNSLSEHVSHALLTLTIPMHLSVFCSSSLAVCAAISRGCTLFRLLMSAI